MTVGMKPELVDTTLKRKEREKQMQENVDDRRFFLQEPENGKVHQLTSLHIAENKTKESLSECPRERQECHNQMDKHISKHSNSCDNHDKPQTFYIFDPRNNTYEPVIIVKQKENQKLDCIDNSDVVQDTLVIRDGTSISSYERAFNERRVSVIQKLESSQVENPKIANEKTTHLFNQKQEDCIDIEKIVDICFSEEINKNEDQEMTEQSYRNSIQEKRQRKISTGLPFKKRRMCDQFQFLSTAIQNNQTLVAAFTFEEEFRLHDLVVRRDSVVEEMMKYMLLKGPSIMKSSLEQFSKSLNKKEKIHHTESQFEFGIKCSHEFVSFKCQEVFDEFKELDIRCFCYSLPATHCLMLGINCWNKHLGLKEQAKLIGHTGVTSRRLWEQYFSNIEQLGGLGFEDYSMFTSPWAQTFEDEQFFTYTTTTIGKLIGSDLKLCVLYFMLLLSSQPRDSPFVENSQLKHLQLDLGLLLYRYLTTKMGQDEAAKQAHNLIGLLASLHECGDILLNRRIRMLPEDA